MKRDKPKIILKHTKVVNSEVFALPPAWDVLSMACS